MIVDKRNNNQAVSELQLQSCDGKIVDKRTNHQVINYQFQLILELEFDKSSEIRKNRTSTSCYQEGKSDTGSRQKDTALTRLDCNIMTQAVAIQLSDISAVATIKNPFLSVFDLTKPAAVRQKVAKPLYVYDKY